MATKIMTRWRASALHLLLSVVIAAAVLAFMLALWFPGPLFVAGGGNHLLFILVSVDVTIGPLITLAVYRQGKRGMKFDLAVIAIMQLAAFTYGMHIIYLARPAFIVFAKDQFQVAEVVAIEPAEYAKAKFPQFRHPPMGGPLYAYGVIPTDPEAHNQLVLSGKDVENFPKLFEPYEAHTADVLANAQTLDTVRKKEPAYAKIIDAYMKESGLKEADVRYVRLRAHMAWVAVLIDAKTAKPLKMLVVEKF